MDSKITLENIFLEKVVLVNFEPRMIPKYFLWMQDDFLLDSTSTDSLTLQDVHNLYDSWKADPDKYTYIICDKLLYNPKASHCSMIGDVNLFIFNRVEAEVNIMIAESQYRNRGIASEVLSFLKNSVKSTLGLRRLHAKISEQNINSQKLFIKQGFKEISRIPDFEEIHYVYEID